MGRVVVSELITLDGVIEDPIGLEDFEHGGWAVRIDQGEDGRQIKIEEMFTADALLMGRRTYEGLVAALPVAKDYFGLVRKVTAMPKYVVSSTLEEPELENTTVLRGEPVEQVTMLKQALDGEILVPGSAQLVQTLFEEDLLDAIRLMVYPVLLEAGKTFLPARTEPKPMRLARNERVGKGIVFFVFEPRELEPGEAT